MTQNRFHCHSERSEESLTSVLRLTRVPAAGFILRAAFQAKIGDSSLRSE
jgi:hypothetical protein